MLDDGFAAILSHDTLGISEMFDTSIKRCPTKNRQVFGVSFSRIEWQMSRPWKVTIETHHDRDDRLELCYFHNKW